MDLIVERQGDQYVMKQLLVGEWVVMTTPEEATRVRPSITSPVR